MSKAYIDESSLTGIGNAIRSVNGSSSLYTPSQMANEILTLTSGGLTYKGTVSSQSQLPSDPSDGDLYIVGNQTMFWSDTDNEWKTISVQSAGGISTVKVNGTPLVEDSQGAVDVVIPSWSMQQSKPSYTASEVGAVATSSVGSASGVASLGSDGKVPSSQLPSSSQIDFATQSEAETGTDNTKAMTPLRVAQEILAKTDTNLSSSSSNPVKNYAIKQYVDERFMSRNVADTDGSPARSSHPVGSYVVVDGLLYKVTSAISVGDTIDFNNAKIADIGDMIADVVSSGVSVSWSDVQDKPAIDTGEGAYSVQEGGGYASGPYSHAEGDSQANGYGSHSEGHNCNANGYYSHAGGSESYAEGINAFAHGTGAMSASTWEHPQFVIGSYNVSDTVYDEDSGEYVDGERYAFIIGDGTYGDDRHNLFTISWDGKVVISDHTLVTDSNIAQVEEETASRAYSVGEYMMRQGVLKRVTSAISSGDSIADGTNVTTTTIMEEIVRLTQ